MRFNVSIVCLILVGILSPEGNAQQFESLPALNEFALRNSEERKTDLDIELQHSSANTTTNKSGGLGSAFSNNLYRGWHGRKRLGWLENADGENRR